jgi:outer membrane protein assembly factor BamB
MKSVTSIAVTKSCLVTVQVLILAGLCFSEAITLSPKGGPPTSTTHVSGRAFPPNAEINIYFDTTLVTTLYSNSAGSFFKRAFQIPASAVPGQHWVTAQLASSPETGAQVPFGVNTNWSQFHFSADRAGLNPYENVLNVDNVSGMDLLWSYPTSGAVESSPAVVDGVVYVGSDDDNVYALRARTGTLLWSYTTNGAIGSSPAVVNGVVYVGSYNGTVYALNAKTGALVWSYTTNNGVTASPTVVNGIVYVGSYDDNVYALNASTGALLWSYTTNGAINSSPAVANGVVYVGPDDSLYALNASTGALLWGPYIFGGDCTPAVVNGVVYSTDGEAFYATQASTAGVVWEFNPLIPSGSPAVANETLYIGIGYGLQALNTQYGAPVWGYETNGNVNSSSAVANGVVYVGSEDWNLYALNASTGALLWNYTTGGNVDSSPAVANGVVYVGSDDNFVYAFGLANNAEAAPSRRPSLKTLRPNFDLKPSLPVQERSQ